MAEPQTADPVADVLRMAPLTQTQRAAAWDAYDAAPDADALATKLQDLQIPKAVKAKLWDLKEQQAPPADFQTTNQKDASGNATAIDWNPLSSRNLQTAYDRSGVPSLIELGKGAVKGVASTAVGLGQMFRDYTPVGRISDAIQPGAFEHPPPELQPTNTLQKVGKYAEQAGEFLIPSGAGEKVAATVAAKTAPYFRNAPRFVQAASRMAPRMATNAAASAGVAKAQGGDPASAAVAGAIAPPLGAAVGAGAEWIASKADPLVRAAVKPTVAAMRRVAGASVTGIDAQATKLVRFIIDNGVTTADKARTIITQAEQELQRVLSVRNAVTDAPQRAVRYLSALERSAAKQGLPAADVATIRNAAAEVLESGLGEDVVTMVPKPHPTLVDQYGKPITVLVPETSRALRTDVTATEALERARANSRWDTRKAWGEQKGAQTEASKTVERAERDAVKEAVPAARPILAKQGQAIQAADVLDRMEFRQANRDAVSLPAHVMAAGEIASGRVPMLAFAANWLRNNQMKAGIWADRLGKAIARQDVQETAAILNRLGVGATAQAASPAK